MRQIQITIPNEPPEHLRQVLDILEEQLGIKYMIVLKGEHNSLIIIRRTPTKVAEVVEKLNEIGVGITYGIIDILNLEATIPEYAAIAGLEKKEIHKEIPERISLQEIKEIIEEGTRLNSIYFIFIILSALITGCGLIMNNSAVIIASMILCPLLSPILGVSFGIISKDRKLIQNGILGQLYGILILISIGIVLGFIAFLSLDSLVITQEMAERQFPNYFDLIIAISSGVAVGFCLTSGIATMLVGVAIAVALNPPAVNIGLALIYGDPFLSLGSLILLLLNIIAINVSAIIIFKIKKVTAPPEMNFFWRGPKEKYKEMVKKKSSKKINRK